MYIIASVCMYVHPYVPPLPVNSTAALFVCRYVNSQLANVCGVRSAGCFWSHMGLSWLAGSQKAPSLS